MDITIRRAGAADAEALSLVARATFLEAFAGFIDGADILARLRDEESEDFFARWLADPAGALWLAEAAPGAAPVGYAGLAAPDLPIPVGAKDVELKRIYVLHRFHGGGAARALLEAALAHARQARARRMLIGVKDDNHRAIAFYAKHGFAQVGVRRFQVGANHYDDLVLARALA